ENTGAVPGIETARGRDRAGDCIPGPWPLEPEARDLCLLVGTSRADLATDTLDLIEVARVGLARQRRWPGKPELRSGKQREWRDISPAWHHGSEVAARQVRVGDRRVGWNGVRMRTPLARTHARCVGRVAAGTVVLAKRENRRAGGAADRDSFVPGGPVGDARD